MSPLYRKWGFITPETAIEYTSICRMLILISKALEGM